MVDCGLDYRTFIHLEKPLYIWKEKPYLVCWMKEKGCKKKFHRNVNNEMEIWFYRRQTRKNKTGPIVFVVFTTNYFSFRGFYDKLFVNDEFLL